MVKLLLRKAFGKKNFRQIRKILMVRYRDSSENTEQGYTCQDSEANLWSLSSGMWHRSYRTCPHCFLNTLAEHSVWVRHKVRVSTEYNVCPRPPSLSQSLVLSTGGTGFGENKLKQYASFCSSSLSTKTTVWTYYRHTDRETETDFKHKRYIFKFNA